MIESSFEFTVSSKNKPILIASGHGFYFKRKNKFTENWICSKYQTVKCRATAITEINELIETLGEHNHDISAGKLEARNVIRHIKDLSERFTPTVAVASAVLPITNDLATQFALGMPYFRDARLGLRAGKPFSFVFMCQQFKKS